MRFYDCNLSYGIDTPATQLRGCKTFAELKAQMRRAGIAGGLVTMALGEVNISNAALANDIKGEKDIWGVWRLLPSCTGEIPSPALLPAAMKAAGVAALTICPDRNRYQARAFVIGDYLEMATERKIPVLLDTARGLTLEQAADVMSEFPKLTAVLNYANCWPSDRLFRPFLDAFPNLYLDMSYAITANWLPDICKIYPARRILFGSAFPESYLGANMMVIKHAEISEEEKRLIAGENLLRMLGEVRYGYDR